MRCAIANQTAHGFVRHHNLGGGANATSIPLREQAQTDDRAERIGQADARVFLFLRRE
jgi:hypothetical protein